jgi:AcrR family transcriptional regulator
MRHYADPAVRGDDVVGAVHTLVAHGGIRAVTYRKVAALVGLSVSSLHDNFPNKSHLLNIAAYELSLRRLNYFGAASGVEILHRMIPESDIDLHQAVIWLALRDHGRIEPMLSPTLAEAEQAERTLIRRALRDAGIPDAGPAMVDALAALLEGLASSRTVGRTPAPLAGTRAALDAVLNPWIHEAQGDDGDEAAA